MDPVSQGMLGAAAAELTVGPKNRQHMVTIALLGALAGMAADLDLLIYSPWDPILFLEYHRHFTHALAFIPVGALITAAALYALHFRHKLSFWHTYLCCLVGYATHGLLDCFTTYGTHLLWPFTNERIAWNLVSVVDPLLTAPALALVILAGRRRDRRLTCCALLWTASYLGLGFLQHQRAEDAGLALALTRGHKAQQIEVKPSFGNLLLWKSIYQQGDRFYVDGVRAGLEVKAWSGGCVIRFSSQRDLPWLDKDSQQARDIERFRHFSNNYLAFHKADNPTITDIRYTTFPDETNALWGIRLNPDKGPDEHVEYFVNPRLPAGMAWKIWHLLSGKPPIADAVQGIDCSY